MAIEKLALLDEVTASTVLAMNVNGVDYRVLPDTLNTYLETLATSTNGINTQYSAPSATGFSVSLTDSSDNAWLILTPAANYANGTINLPSAANSIINQEIVVNCTRSITTLDVLSSGASVVGHPTTLAVNGYFRMRYDSVLKTWYRVG